MKANSLTLTRILLGTAATVFATHMIAQPTGKNSNLLWYDKPAEKWVQALPVGNGRLGAMVFGQPENDHLQLNDITIWSGGPQSDTDRPDAWKHLAEIRKAIREGDYKLAERLCNTKFNSPAPYEASYQTLGDLTFKFELPDGVVTNYSRWLDLEEAVAGVKFQIGDAEFRREIFSSAPDQVLVEHLTSSKKGGLSFSVKLNRPISATTGFVAPDTLVMTGNTDMPKLKGNVDYEVQARVLVRNGKVTGAGDELRVENADEATVLLTCGTSYVLDHAKNYRGADPEVAASRMKAASGKSYASLKAAHVADYQKYFHRVRLDIGPSDAAAAKLPTDERLKVYGDGKRDPAFAALFFQYGRYLLISSSRPDSPLPANLQGLWNHSLNPPWNCDYHVNINIEMIYWPAEMVGLADAHLPMIHFTENLATPGAKTAKAYFGPETPGWVCGYTANAWGWTSPGAQLPWGVWFGGSAWMCQDLWEHFAFTHDTNYLRRVYPTMKSAAEFWLANLIPGPNGKLIPSPSSSPENNFTTDKGITSTVTEGTTIDRTLIWDLFDNTAWACAVLGLDADFQKQLESTRDRIEPLRIGKAGQLMEWNGDWDLNAKDMHHRHISQLFPLFPGHQIDPRTMRKFTAAAKKSLELRGDDGTGWSIAWKENCWARLGDGNHVQRLLSDQLRFTEETRIVMADAGGTYPNLFDAHPPFQMDGNLGAVSAMAQMLLQSSERSEKASAGMNCVIDLLPALPSTWPDGSVTGLRARGGFVVDIIWKKGKLVSATLHSDLGGSAELRYASTTHSVHLKKGGAFSWGGK